jgi:hypothetical protein
MLNASRYLGTQRQSLPFVVLGGLQNNVIHIVGQNFVIQLLQGMYSRIKGRKSPCMRESKIA